MGQSLGVLFCAEAAAAGEEHGQEDSKAVWLGGAEGGRHLHPGCREHRAPRGAQAGFRRTTACEASPLLSRPQHILYGDPPWILFHSRALHALFAEASDAVCNTGR